MSTPQPVVYITQDNPNHAFWPAEKYGKLQHCLPARIDLNVGVMVPRLRAALRDFDPEVDYLLLSGAPITQLTAGAILHEKADRFNVLRWSTQSQEYVVAAVDLLATTTEGQNGLFDTEKER